MKADYASCYFQTAVQGTIQLKHPQYSVACPQGGRENMHTKEFCYFIFVPQIYFYAGSLTTSPKACQLTGAED